MNVFLASSLFYILQVDINHEPFSMNLKYIKLVLVRNKDVASKFWRTPTDMKGGTG